MQGVRKRRTLFILHVVKLLLTATLTTPSHVPGAEYCKYCDSFHKCPVMQQSVSDQYTFI